MSTIVESAIEIARTHPPQKLRMSEEEYERWHDEELTGEWVDGEVELMSPAVDPQAQLQGWLYFLLHGYVTFHSLGQVRGPEFPVKMAMHRRQRLPDLLFVSTARSFVMKKSGCDGPPDFVLEIVSPESTVRDYRVKYQEYERFGIPEYWIVDPQAEIVEASLLDANGVYQPILNVEGRIASTVIPGWYLRPEWLWTDPPRNSIEVLRELKVM